MNWCKECKLYVHEKDSMSKVAYEFRTKNYTVYVSAKENESIVYGHNPEPPCIPRVREPTYIAGVIPKQLSPKTNEEDINKLLVLVR